MKEGGRHYKISDDEKKILQLCRSRLAGQIFDSCPCYLWVNAGLGAIGSAIESFLPRIMLQITFVIFALLVQLLRMLQGNESRPIEFWKHWEGGGGGGGGKEVEVLRKRQLYIYSPRDKLCDVVKLEELIATRRVRGTDVTAIRFDDSDHVVHLRKRPKEYTAALLAFCGLAKNFKKVGNTGEEA